MYRNTYLLTYIHTKLVDGNGQTTVRPDYGKPDQLKELSADTLLTGIHKKGDNFLWKDLFWTFIPEDAQGAVNLGDVVTIRFQFRPDGSIGAQDLMEPKGFDVSQVEGKDSYPVEGGRPKVFVDPAWPRSGTLLVYGKEADGAGSQLSLDASAPLAKVRLMVSGGKDVSKAGVPGSEVGKDLLVENGSERSNNFRFWDGQNLCTITGRVDHESTKAVAEVLLSSKGQGAGPSSEENPSSEGDFQPLGDPTLKENPRFAAVLESMGTQGTRSILAKRVIASFFDI